MFPRIRRALVSALVLLPLATAACVDAPAAPDGSGPGGFVLMPVFSLVGPNGPAMSEGQEDALSEAFDLVNRFRLQVFRASDKALVLDTVIVVTPGGDEYDLSVGLQAQENEQFLVTLTAMQGETELFKAENIPAKAAPVGVQGAPPPAPVQIPLRYSGPGATATSIEVGPTQVVLAPGGTGTVGAAVKDAGGAVISGVPVAWTTAAAGTATVSPTGQVTGTGEGITTVTATTPTGLAASATVYVVAGELAYVEGGVLKVRGVAGGTAAERGAGASQPSWSADGGRLYHVAGGVVHANGSALGLTGEWPAESPDGTKLAVQRGGTVFFANDDGSQATGGPTGTAPVWRDGVTLLVGGGSIQQVKADGTGRTTVVEGAASLPALAADGRIAALVGSELRVGGVASALVSGASGRATWSPNGMWLVVGTGSGLVLVPSDGSAAAVPLPGLGGASDPAWRRAGSLSGPPSVSVTGFSPDPPVPGSPVRIVGSGFDWIIPSNNHVVWPTRDGSLETPITAVTETSLSTELPRNVIAGQVRVETRTGTALPEFVPTVGGLDVTARTPWGTAVAGVGLSLAGSGGTETGTTGDSGLAQFSGLIPGSYTLTISAPEGYDLEGAAVRTLSIGGGVDELGLTLTPGITSVALAPAEPALAVGGTQGVSLSLTGPGGVSIPQVAGLAWRSGSAELTVTPGAGLNATLGAVFAGEGAGTSVLEVDAAGRTYSFPVSVTSRIEGTVTLDGSAPAPGVAVQVKRGGALVAEATTGPDGRYAVTGLFRGTYDVAPAGSADRLPVPEGQTVTLDQANPTGTADFRMVSFATLEVTSRTPWDTPAGGATIVLFDAAGAEVARKVVDGEGNLRIERLQAGTYSVTILSPPGFALQGAATRSLEIVGTVSLALVFEPSIAQVRIEPAEPRMEVGSVVRVTATALDFNGRIIPEFRSATWFARSAHLSAAGAGLEGQVGGVIPSEEGGASFALELNGQIFTFAATVTSYITGKVTISSEGGSRASVGTGIIVEKNGSRVAETSTQAGGAYRFDGLLAGTYTVKPGVPSGYSVSPTSKTLSLEGGTPTGTADFVITEGVVGKRRSGDIVIYKRYNAWFGENKDENTLKASPFNFTRDTDYFVRSTADLQSGIPSSTSLIILTSASNGSSPVTDVNNATAQANLDAWVRAGGWLLAHMGDNEGSGGFLIPGMSGPSDGTNGCTGETLAVADHPFIRGPDGVLGTGDDLTNTNIDNGGRFCSDNHGALAGILPAGAQVLMTEQGGSQRPTYATYTHGAGRVVVTTLTIEFGSHTQQTLTNHFWWTIKSGAPAAAAALVAPSPVFRLQAGGALPRTDVIPAQAPAAIRYSPWTGAGSVGRRPQGGPDR